MNVFVQNECFCFCINLSQKKLLVHSSRRPFSQQLRSEKYTLFEHRDFCSFAPLKHCAEAIQLSEELSKVLGQLP